MNKLIIPLIIIIATLSRLIPHPPNFTPIIAMSIFSGAYIANTRNSILIIVLTMLISDYVIGFHSLMPWIYISLVMIVLLNKTLNDKKRLSIYLIASIQSSLIFFIVSNFGVWLTGTLYSKSVIGLINCYAMAIPFFQNTLFSTIIYSACMWSVYHIVNRYSSRILPNS